MITFAVERFGDALEELQPIFPVHFQELALHQSKPEAQLDPDFPQYIDIENRGGLMFIAGRQEGRIVAYFIGFVRRHIHYRSLMCLAMDIYYFVPQVRGGFAGIKNAIAMFRFIEQEARNRGIHVASFGSKMHRDSAALFQRLGYPEVERYFQIWLGE